MRRLVGMPALAYQAARPYCPSVEGDARYRLQRISGGFTIMEIIIVVVIIGIAAMLAVPMMSSASSLQIRSAANMVAADLEYARSMAISRGQYFYVVFDDVNESYRIEDQNSNVIQHPVKKGFTYVISYQNDSRLSRVGITGTSFSNDKVRFDYLGSPDAGGNVVLQADGTSKTIIVEPVTGFISIQ
jgi:prepilin-type N-terminal cleavage/methylation domain-containing protein